MQVELIDFFKSARRKICGHSDFYVFMKNGKCFTGRKCDKRSTPPTAEELAHRQKWAEAIKAVDLILKDPEQKAQALLEYVAHQDTYTSLRNYLIAREMKKA